MVWIKDVIHEFSRPGQIVVDLCASKVSTRNVGILLQSHRRFVGGKVDTPRFKESVHSVVEVFAWLLFNNRFNIAGKPDVQAAGLASGSDAGWYRR